MLAGVQPVRDHATALHAELTQISDCGRCQCIDQLTSFRERLSASLPMAELCWKRGRAITLDR